MEMEFNDNEGQCFTCSTSLLPFVLFRTSFRSTLFQVIHVNGMSWIIVLFQWILPQLLRGCEENLNTHSMIMGSGFNTDNKSSEPLKISLFCYVMLYVIRSVRRTV